MSPHSITSNPASWLFASIFARECFVHVTIEKYKYLAVVNNGSF